MIWFVYIVRCSDDTLYTGCTNDLSKRMRAHDAGRGARYTRGRGPVEVVYFERKRSCGAALSREAAIKSLSASEKRALVIRRGRRGED